MWELPDELVWSSSIYGPDLFCPLELRSLHMDHELRTANCRYWSPK